MGLSIGNSDIFISKCSWSLESVFILPSNSENYCLQFLIVSAISLADSFFSSVTYLGFIAEYLALNLSNSTPRSFIRTFISALMDLVYSERMESKSPMSNWKFSQCLPTYYNP